MSDIHAPHPADCTCSECRPEPAAGDIVLVHVPPRHSGRGRAAPKPALVLEVRDEGGLRRALVAPGAPATGRPARRSDVYLTACDLRGMPGMDGPHVFVARRPVLVPLGRDGAETGLKLLGRLDGRARVRLEALRGRFPGRDGAAAPA